MTLNWTFPDGRSIRTHLSNINYNPPEGLYCDNYCFWYWHFAFKRGKTDWYFAETKMQFTYDPWYFYGNDFTFSSAEGNFWFLEKAMSLWNDTKMSLFSDYLNNIQNYGDVKLREFTDDFFVYEEGNGDSWSGYFTTKPDLKRSIRDLGHLMRALRKFAALTLNDIS